MLNKDYWLCPFCDKGTIEVLIRPSSYRHQRTYGAGKGSIFKRVSQDVTILTEQCSNCSKNSEEIEKEFRRKNII